MNMARLSDTNIVDLSNCSDGVFYKRNVEIEVVNYKAPFIKRLFGRTPSVYDILWDACYIKYRRVPTYVEWFSVFALSGSMPRFYYSELRVTPIMTVPFEKNVFKDADINGAQTLLLEIELKDDTVVPFIHVYPDGRAGITYTFCANNYGREAVVQYTENEYIPYLTSVKYSLFAENLREVENPTPDCKFDYDRLVLTPKTQIKVNATKMSCRTDYPETN